MVKKVGLYVGVTLVLVLVVLSVVIAMRPAEFEVRRSKILHASQQAAFEQVNDFHNWPKWSPWAHMDPQMKTTFEGADKGEGAVYEWSGNDKVGRGKQTILKSQPFGRIDIQLEFIEPWTATNQVVFEFRPQAAGTEASWTMRGHHNFMGKAFGLFVDMDSMVGKDFEKGLTQLERAASAAPQGASLAP